MSKVKKGHAITEALLASGGDGVHDDNFPKLSNRKETQTVALSHDICT